MRPEPVGRFAREQRSAQAGEERFHLLVDGVIDYAIFMIDPDGCIASWNAGAERLKGYVEDEVLGRHFRLFYTPEDRARQLPEEVLRIAAAEGRFEGEGLRVRKDGSPFVAHVVLTPLRAADGALRGFAKVTRDVTERKRQEENLRRQAHRLETLHRIDRDILRASSIGGVAAAALERVRDLVRCENAFLWLFDERQEDAELVASSDGGLWPEVGTRVPLEALAVPGPDKRGGVVFDDLASAPDLSLLLARLRDQGVRSLLRVPLAAGDRVVGLLGLGARSLSAFDDDDREAAAEVAAQLAVAAEQARLRERLAQHAEELEKSVAERTARLEEINSELEAFSYTISHDLRAPLRAVEGLAEALLEDYGERLDGTGRDYARRLVASARRMEELIQDLLAYSRLSRQSLAVQRVSLTDLVAHVLSGAGAEREAGLTGVTVEGALPDVVAHPGTLAQVLQNLVRNALKFVAPGVRPRVAIRAGRHGDRVRLVVEDNGIGIAPEHQERIFRVFERLHGDEAYPGTGIGLAIVRRGAERMGGAAGVESAPGGGSRFWVDLPAAGER